MPARLARSTTPGDEGIATHLAPMLTPIDWVHEAEADARSTAAVRRALTERVEVIRSRHAVACHARRARIAESPHEARRILRSPLDGEATGLHGSDSCDRVTRVLFEVPEVALARGQDDLAWEVLRRAADHGSVQVLSAARRALADADALPVWHARSDELAAVVDDRDLLVVVRPGRAADALDQYLAACNISAKRGWRDLASWRPDRVRSPLLGDGGLGRGYGPLRPLRHTDTELLLARGETLAPRPRKLVSVEAFPWNRPGDIEYLLVRTTDGGLGDRYGWTPAAPEQLRG